MTLRLRVIIFLVGLLALAALNIFLGFRSNAVRDNGLAILERALQRQFVIVEMKISEVDPVAAVNTSRAPNCPMMIVGSVME